jgi:hypothetical protein
MNKKKNFAILMVLVLSIALLAGSVMAEEAAGTQPAGNLAASGTLKAVDGTAGTVTIASDGGEELVLKLTAGSKIQISGSPVDVTQLASKLDAKVSVEYQTEEKTVLSISIE